tara:strand:+ start:298 stop:432 length:135 start_codon:yes stop_codon:yes gene_type:complete
LSQKQHFFVSFRADTADATADAAAAVATAEALAEARAALFVILI